MIPSDLRQRIIDPLGIRTITPLAAGMSGARLYRCEADESLVLRQWPDSTSPARVREIHAVVAPASRHCPLIPGYRPLPARRTGHEPTTWTRDSLGRLWDLSRWMPGQPLEASSGQEAISRGAVAIAQVHHAFGQALSVVQWPPAVLGRLERIEQLSRRLPACLDGPIAGRVHPLTLSPLTDARELLRSRWSPVASVLVGDLTRHRIPSPLQPVLRDVHREHVLFVDSRVSGVIDFDAIRVDSPATDLARWMGSFDSFWEAPDSTLAAVLAGYEEGRALIQRPRRADLSDCGTPGIWSGPVPSISTETTDSSSHPDGNPIQIDSPEFRTLVMALAISSAWISLANWVIWLVDEQRQFPDFERVAGRLSRLIDAADRLPEC